MIECRTGCPTPTIIPRAEHTHFAVATSTRRAEGALPAAAGATTSPTWSAAACATCCSAAGPKDFDIGTSAHPYQVKKLFRNCWIIGRRFRLAHVKFGTKTIEVATFRRQLQPERGAGRAGRRRCARGRRAGRGRRSRGRARSRRTLHPARQHVRHARRGRVPPRLHGQRAVLRHRDVLDHRLRRRPRGSARARHPLDRRSERAVPGRSRCACCARSCSPRGSTSRSIRPIVDAIRRHAPLIAQGVAGAADRGVLQDPAVGCGRASVPPAGRGRPARADLAPELHAATDGQALWQSLAALDAYRQRFEAIPETLTQPDPARHAARAARASTPAARPRRIRGRHRAASASRPATLGPDAAAARATSSGCGRFSGCSGGCWTSRRRRARKRALMHRGPFHEALTWLEIHGHAPEVVEHWKGFLEGTRRCRRKSCRRRTEPPPAPATPAGRGRRDRRRRQRLPDWHARVSSRSCRSNSRMKSTSASTPASGNAL